MDNDQQSTAMQAQFQIALQYFREGRLQEAEQALLLFPSQADPLHLLGIIAYQKGDTALAVTRIEQAIELNPDGFNYHFDLGQIHQAAHQFDQALDGYSRALALSPEFMQALLAMARLQRLQGQLEDSEASYRKALAIAPDHLEALLALGGVLYEQGKVTESTDAFQQAILVDPDCAFGHYNLGFITHVGGEFNQAIAAYKTAIRLNPNYVDAYFNLGNAYQSLGELDAAVVAFHKVLALNPGHVNAIISLGNTLKQQEKLEQAATSFRQALLLSPESEIAHNNLGSVLKDQGNLSEAVENFRHALTLKTDYFDAKKNLADAYQLQGKLDESLEIYRDIIAAHSLDFDLLHGVANVLFALEKFDESIYFYEKSREIRPDFSGIYCQLGIINQRIGKLDEAASYFKKAIALDPDKPQSYANLGMLLTEQNCLDEAIGYCQKALDIKPDFAEAWNTLGFVLFTQSKLAESMVCFEKAIQLKPDFAEVYLNIGNVQKHKNELEGALLSYQKAFSIDPNYALAHSNFLFVSLYSVKQTPAKLLSAHIDFAQQFEAPLKSKWLPHDNDRTINKRLKIGYVSGDFHKHAAMCFFESIIANHDKSKFEIFCYYNNTKYDQVTQRIMDFADHWTPCSGLPDAVFAERIRSDGIDILIDMSGHTGRNRLTTFARKPAPVQATYLGYASTTGLTAMDYRITDNFFDPPGMTEKFNVEKLWRLPDVASCYSAPQNSPDVIAYPPAEKNGYITFGCFNNFTKVNDRVIAVWAKILERVPTSGILLEVAGVEAPLFYAEIEARFVRHGIASDRIKLLPRSPQNQYALYNRIDIALDPFPYNGGTTSYDTLWMGVPFVTLAGDHCVSRLGVSTLANAGLTELIADSEDHYVNIAVNLATDMVKLTALREGLRERVQQCPLMDGKRFTMQLEEAYRGMWKSWCESDI